MVTTKEIFMKNGAKISKALEYSIPIVKTEYIFGIHFSIFVNRWLIINLFFVRL